jgi:sporulation protein YlmC with PRC-barrel domain
VRSGMRAISMAAATAVALLTVSAYAQSQSPSGGTTMPRGNGAAATAPAPRASTPNPLKQEDVSKIEGASVLGSDGKKLGSVSKVLMKPDDKTIDRLVVHAGGVLGVGGRYVAMPVGDFSWDGDADAFKISKTADDLTSMAEWTQNGETKGTGSSTPAPKSTSPTRSGE